MPVGRGCSAGAANCKAPAGVAVERSWAPGSLQLLCSRRSQTHPAAAPASSSSPCVQAIIGNYAVPILEEKPVWGTTDQTRTAYLDTQVEGS